MKDDIVARIGFNGGVVEISEDVLCKHTIFIGSTGSGKTSTCNVLLRDLIRYKADDKDRKIALIIFDFKGDGTLGKISTWANECGRDSDILDFSPDGKFYYDPLCGFDSLKKLSQYAESILEVLPEDGEHYWQHALRKRITCVLEYVLFKYETPNFENFLNEIFNFLSRTNELLYEIGKFELAIEDILSKSREHRIEYEILKRRLERLKELLLEWQNLDSRTKSNETSTISNLLSAFTNPSVEGLFSKIGRQRLDMEKILEGGKIAVLSFPACVDGFSAAVVAKLLKGGFYTELQKRQNFKRLAGIIMDEYPLVASCGRFGDGVNLQTIRSKGGFVVVATQGLVSLDMAIGRANREQLMLNFNNRFIFRSEEREVKALVDEMNLFSSGNSVGFFPNGLETVSLNVEEFPTGYAVIKLANGFKTKSPVQLERLFIKSPNSQQPENNDPLRNCMDKLRSVAKSVSLYNFMEER